MPWTKKQEGFMWIHHPAIARRVMHEPGYHTKPPKKGAIRRRLSRQKSS